MYDLLNKDNIKKKNAAKPVVLQMSVYKCKKHFAF